MNKIRNMLIAAALIGCVIGVISAVRAYNGRLQRTYEAALLELSEKDYASAEALFSSARSYRDSEPLAVYCKYAQIYKDSTHYKGGSDELSVLKLEYDTEWQKDIDSLEKRIDGYRKARAAALEESRKKGEAEAAKQREASLKARYSGKEPADDMPMDALKYTTLGAPDEVKKCQFYDSMDVHRRYKILRWYDEDGHVKAYCYAHMPKGEDEEIIYAFSYSQSVVVSSDAAPSRSNSTYTSGSIRDEYDSPEDLWEDNRDIYEDEDEAWDEWYDDW